EPIVGPARLSDLVLVVRKDQVVAAAVDLEHTPEVLLRHRRALDVPPGPARPPRRLPNRVLALLVRLPEGEVARVLFELVALGLLGRVVQRVLVIAPGSAAVLGAGGATEVDVAAGRLGG